jgi:hypothetical protein
MAAFHRRPIGSAANTSASSGYKHKFKDGIIAIKINQLDMKQSITEKLEWKPKRIAGAAQKRGLLETSTT